MIDLGTLGGAYGTAMALNNQGQVTGSMDLGGDASEHAFLWGRGSLVDLGTLGGDNSEGYFVNNAGEVVGRADMPGSKTHHAFLWRNRQMLTLAFRLAGHAALPSTLTLEGRSSSTLGSAERVVVPDPYGRMADHWSI